MIFLGHVSAGSDSHCSNLSAHYVTRWPTLTYMISVIFHGTLCVFLWYNLSAGKTGWFEERIYLDKLMKLHRTRTVCSQLAPIQLCWLFLLHRTGCACSCLTVESNSLESIRSSKCRQSPSQDWVQISFRAVRHYGFTWFTAHHKYFTTWSLNDCCFRGENVQFCSQDCISWFHHNPHFWMGWYRQGLYEWFECWWPTGFKKFIKQNNLSMSEIFIFRDNLWIYWKK